MENMPDDWPEFQDEPYWPNDEGSDDDGDYEADQTTCPECNGTGLDWEGSWCQHCDGYGYYWWE